MASYPTAVFPTSLAWEDDVTPLNEENLNRRDDEIRAIEQSLGIGIVPSTADPLVDYLKVAADSADVEHLYLAHKSGLGAKVSVGLVGFAPDRPPPPVARLHVRDASVSGATPTTAADQLALDSSGDAGMSILTGDTSVGAIYFGTTSGSDRARVQYDAGSDTMHIGTNEAGGQLRLRTAANTTAVSIDASQKTTFSGDVAISGDLTGSVSIGAATAVSKPLMNQETTTAGAYFENTGDGATRVYLDANRDVAAEYLGRLSGRWSNNDVAEIAFLAGANTMNKDDGEIAFYTSNSGSNPEERVRIRQDGTVDIASSVILSKQASTPPDPAATNEARLYLYNDKLVVQFKQAGVVHYKWLALDDASVAWQQDTSPPT